MSKIPSEDRDLLEKAIFLPMALTVFNQDVNVFQTSPFKLKTVYLQIVDHAIKAIHKDLHLIKKDMHKRNLKVLQLNKDMYFTQFLFIYQGYEETHNYFNPAIRNYVHEIMKQYIQNENKQ